MNTLDELRAAYPHLSLALYAYTPGGPVTLECIVNGEVIGKFTGRTEAEAINAAFPDEDETPEPERAAQTPARIADSPAASAPPAPTPSVFD